MRRAFSTISKLSFSKHLNLLSPLPNFHPNPSHNFTTLSNQTPISQIPSRQRKIRERTQLDDAFENAESTRDMVSAFERMGPGFGTREIGLAALKLGLKLDQQGEDPEKTLSFALKALNSLMGSDEKTSSLMGSDEKTSSLMGSDEKTSFLPLAMTLQLLGSACFGLKRFSDSLGYLIRASRLLGKIEEEGFCSVDDVRPIVHAVELGLANTKTAMGRREEALGNLKKCLELKELMLGGDSKELGDANRDLAEAYVAVLDFKGAMPFCTKALEIHRAQLGQNSVEVAHDRRVLGVIYTGMEEHEKALMQNQLSQKVLKNWGLSTDLLRAEIDAANIQIALGRYDEAVSTLKTIVQQTDKESYDRALVFVSMGKAMCDQEKYSDAKKCMELACAVLEKKENSSPLEVSEAYMEISMIYETMNEFEKAISLLKKTQSMLEKLPQEQHSEGSVCARIGWLLLLTGKVKEAVPYLEGAAERMKECFGAKHYGVGYIYNNLGAAYLELDRPESAAQMFAVAKDIMDVSLGPAHVDTIEACQNLSKAYGTMGSYQLAIKFQEQVIEAWEGHGPSARDELKEANRVLEQLKKKSREISLNEPPVRALPLPRRSELASTKSNQPDNSFSEKQRNSVW